MNGHALRIFAHAPRRPSLPRPQRTSGAQPSRVAVVADRAACEPRVLEILASAAHAGETIDVEYRRKERELAALFAALAPAEAAALQRRLSDARTDLGARFARLVIERRSRLLAILADAPRRAAATRRPRSS